MTTNDLSVNIRAAELNHLHAEGQRRGRAIREALGSQTITVRRPHVNFGPKGVPMNQADADYLRDAARNIHHARCLGSNLTSTVMALLLDAARAIEAGPEPERSAD